MIEKAAWEEYEKLRAELRREFMELRKREGATEAEKEAAWEKYDADMGALRERFHITALANHRLTGYQVSVFVEADDPEGHIGLSSWALEVTYRGRNLWAVLHRGYCLGKDGVWEYEPSPSNREDDWLKTHRFTRAEALALAYKAAPNVTVNGRSAAELKIELSMEGKIK